jgi:hypothetical protein
MTCHDANRGPKGIVLSVSQAQHDKTLIHIKTKS